MACVMQIYVIIARDGVKILTTEDIVHYTKYTIK